MHIISQSTAMLLGFAKILVHAQQSIVRSRAQQSMQCSQAVRNLYKNQVIIVCCCNRRVAKSTGATVVTTLADMDGQESYDASSLGQADEVCCKFFYAVMPSAQEHHCRLSC